MSSTIKQILHGLNNAQWITRLAFIAAVLLGGSNAVAVRFSNSDLPPFWGATLRFGSAAILFWLIVFIRRMEIPRGRALLGNLLYGTLTVGVSYSLLYWALLYIPASFAMVVGALGPLFTFFFALLHNQENFRWQGLVGSLMAFAGISVGIGNEIGTSIPLLPLLAVAVGFAAISEGSVLFKTFPKSNPLTVNAVALTMGTVILALISLIAGEEWRLPVERETWIAYVYLVLGGSSMLFYLYLYILQRWTATATSYSALLFPIVTIFIASWLENEVISSRFLIGTGVVLVGVWIGAIAQSKRLQPMSSPGKKGSKKNAVRSKLKPC